MQIRLEAKQHYMVIFRDLSSWRSILGKIISIAMLLIVLLVIITTLSNSYNMADLPILAYLLLLVGWGLAGAPLLGMPVQYLIVSFEYRKENIWPIVICISLGLCIYILGLIKLL